MRTRREESEVAELARLADWAAVRPSRIAAWWSPMTRDVSSVELRQLTTNGLRTLINIILIMT